MKHKILALCGENAKAGLQYRKKKATSIFFKAVIYFLLLEFVFVFIYPYLFMVVNSLKYDYEIKDASTQWVVTNFNFKNFKDAFRLMDFPNALKNSLIVAVVSTVGHVISCSFVAYGLARFKTTLNKIIFILVVFTLLIPPQIISMPQYILYSKIKWIGTFLPIIIPCFLGFGLRGGLFIFLFRQYFKGLPKEYEEAAKIEGCGYLKLFWRISFPMAKGPILVVSILSATWHWNDSFEPSTFLKSPNLILPQMLESLNNLNFVYETGNGTYINPIGLAGCVLTILPLVLMYLYFQKKFIQGIETTGLAN